MTTRQRLFNLFMEEFYPELTQHFAERDLLHSAYVNVFELAEPIQRGTFEHLVSNSYHRFRRKERNYAMHFILPDPVFWLLQAEQLQEPEPQDDGRSVEEEEREKKNVHSFLRSMFSDKEVFIYDLVMNKGCDIKDVCKLTGWTWIQTSELIDKMEDAIRNNYSKPHKRKKDSK